MGSVAGKRRKRQTRSVPCQRFDVPAFLMPQTRAELQELAGLMAAAGWAPESYRDLEGDYVREKIEMAILHGASVGLGPVAAAQSIAVIEGMPTIWGDGALALVERSGLLEDMSEEFVVDDTEGLTAICTMRRRGRRTPIVNRFSMAMAEQAQLTRREGPWQTYTQRMLRMRARSWTIRDGFSDVLRGLHIREEVEDYAGPTLGARPQRTSVHSKPNALLTGSPRPHFGSEGGAPSLTSRSGVGQVSCHSRRAGDAQPSPANGLCPDPGPMNPDEGIGTEPAHGVQSVPAASVGSNVGKAAKGGETGVPMSGAGQDSAESLAPSSGPIYTLVDADGVITEHSDVGALKRAFEQIMSDEELSPDRRLAVWDRNQPAIYVIKARFGETALQELRKGSRSVRDLEPKPTRMAPIGPVAMTAMAPRPRRGTEQRSVDRAPSLQLEINPGWGDQKIYQQYRSRLLELHRGGAGKASVLAQFRETNRPLELRLRQKLPHFMKQIDALYADAALNAR